MSPQESPTRTKKRNVNSLADFQPLVPGTKNGHRPKPKPKKRDEVAAELALELRELRARVDEVTEHFRLRVGGEIEELLQRIEGQQIDGKVKKPSVKTAQAMRERLREHSVKPRKGRAKDFARIQELVEDLADLLPPED